MKIKIALLSLLLSFSVMAVSYPVSNGAPTEEKTVQNLEINLDNEHYQVAVNYTMGSSIVSTDCFENTNVFKPMTYILVQSFPGCQVCNQNQHIHCIATSKTRPIKQNFFNLARGKLKPFSLVSTKLIHDS